MPGKRVQFDQETWNALDLLARDSMRDFQELADEAFADLLRKHCRPVDLRGRLQGTNIGRNTRLFRAGRTSRVKASCASFARSPNIPCR
jgi:hypothetical protein